MAAGSFETVYNRFEEAHAEDFRKLSDWIDRLYVPALADLQIPFSFQFALSKLTLQFASYPHLVRINGRPLIEASPDKQSEWFAGFYPQAALGFLGWYRKHLAGEADPVLKSAITQRSKRYFSQWWMSKQGGKGEPPDWEKIQEAHNRSGEEFIADLYQPYVRIYTGIQIAALEEYAQTTVPRDFFGQE